MKNKLNESLLRSNSKRQLEELNRTIKKSGGDIQDIVKKSEKTKEDKLPNTYYMDNPFDSKRKSIDTWEHWSKNDAHKKSIAMKSRDPKSKPKNMYTKFENFNNKLNESSYSDFLINYSNEIRESIKILRKISKIYDDLTPEDFLKIEKILDKYDDNVGSTIDDWMSGNVTVDDIAKFAIENQDKYGTEPQMILQSIKDVSDILNIEVNESKNDEEKYLTPKQRKLPDGLKKGIIKKMKKSGKKVNESKSITKKRGKDSTFARFHNPKKLNNLRNFHEIPYNGKTTIKSDITDDSWIRGDKYDKSRPMFKNLPNKEIRYNYDVLRSGKSLTIDGIQGIIIGIKDDKLLLDVVNDENKHEIKKYDMKKVIKDISKNNKTNENIFNKFKKNPIDMSHLSKNTEEGDDIQGNRTWRQSSDKNHQLEFPVVYAFLTEELENKLRELNKPVSLFNDGYKFYCKNPEKLKYYKEKYKEGNKYKEETITYTGYKSEKDINV